MIDPKEESLHKEGFTTIETLIVAALIAILAAISYAAYTSFLKKAKMIEAIIALDQIADMENLYYIEHGKYTDDQNLLGLTLERPLRYYTITITIPAEPSPKSFEATVSGDIDTDPNDLDTWTIDQNRNLIHTVID